VAAKLSFDFSYRFQKGGRLSVSSSTLAAGAGITVILGPSGSGKSTLLHCLAGLRQPEEGFIRNGQSFWFHSERRIHCPSQLRPMTLLFQDYPLFPHLNVLDNILYGLKKPSQKDLKKRGLLWLERVGLKGQATQRPGALSGGERQRAALAQVMAPDPDLLLLDEPFSALDQATRSRIRNILREWVQAVGASVLIASHHLPDALALGKNLIVLSEGKILQQGNPLEIFNRPSHPSVARVVGFENLLAGSVIRAEKGLVHLELGASCLVGSGLLRRGERAFAAVRAEEVILEKGRTRASSARNHLKAKIHSIEPCGFHVDVLVDCGGWLRARIPAQSAQELKLKPGDEVSAVIKSSSVHMIPAGSSASEGA